MLFDIRWKVLHNYSKIRCNNNKFVSILLRLFSLYRHPGNRTDRCVLSVFCLLLQIHGCQILETVYKHSCGGLPPVRVALEK